MTDELNPIPEGSIVTEEMLAAYMAFHPDIARDVAIGSLNGFEAGMGELPARLMNGNEVFYPLMEAYCKALNKEMPEDWRQPLVEAEEKLPEAPEATT